MSDDGNGGRTHEPSLRELTAELDGLRELLLSKMESVKDVIDERDKLYKERDDARRVAVDAALAAAKAAVDAALIAVKEQTKASFEASEKAIVKAEEAQKSYNQTHNDLSRKLDEQNKMTMPRSETETRFAAIEEKFVSLREIVTTHRASDSGKTEGISSSWAVLLGAVSLISTLTAIGALAFHSQTAPPQPQIIYSLPPAGTLLPSTPPSPIPR